MTAPLEGMVLPAIKYDEIAPAPKPVVDPRERAELLGLMHQRAGVLERTAVRKDLLVMGDVYERAEELAGQLGIMAYTGATGLLGLINVETDSMPRDDAQHRIERILIASGAARVLLAFTPGTGYGVLSEVRTNLVHKLGYEPIGTQLADTTEFDKQHGIKPKRHRLGSIFKNLH